MWGHKTGFQTGRFWGSWEPPKIELRDTVASMVRRARGAARREVHIALLGEIAKLLLRLQKGPPRSTLASSPFRILHLFVCLFVC